MDLLDLPINIKQDILNMVPLSIMPDIRCFTIYDNYPCDDKCIDIIVCTSKGEIIEFYQKHIVCKILVDTNCTPNDILIHRSSVGAMYYFLSAATELFIYSRNNIVEFVKKFENVDRFSFEDPLWNGTLKLWLLDDPVPLVCNDNFEYVQERFDSEQFEQNNEYCSPIINILKRKLSEAKYTVAQNETVYKDRLTLRQHASYSILSQINNEVTSSLNIWMKLCNKKIVISVNIENCKVPMSDIEVLLHNEKLSIEYKTSLYRRIDYAPYWTKMQLMTLEPDMNASIVVRIDIKELKCTVAENIIFNSVVLYKSNNKQRVLPLNKITLLHKDTVNENFDVLALDTFDNSCYLAILATSVETEIILTLLEIFDLDIVLSDIFCTYMNMERLPNCSNIVIHKQSPYHSLNGVMIVFHDNGNENNQYRASIFSRSQCQVLTLIHFIYSTFPYRTIVTLPDTEITPKRKSMEDIFKKDLVDNNPKLLRYGQSLLNQISVILKYYDDCIVQMGQSKDEAVKAMHGNKIDLLISGKIQYEGFFEKLNVEVFKGLAYLSGDLSSEDEPALNISECNIIDVDEDVMESS